MVIYNHIIIIIINEGVVGCRGGGKGEENGESGAKKGEPQPVF